MHRIFLTLFVLFVTIFTIASARLDKSDGKIVLGDNMSVRIFHENVKGIPDFVSGTLSNRITSGTEIASAIKFFESNRSTFKMNDPAAELVPNRIDQDQLGMKHVRFHQKFNGVRVIGGVMIAHFSSDDVLKTVNGNYESEINLNINASVSADNAAAIAASDLENFFAVGTADIPELVVFPWENNNYLCWRFFVKTTAKMGRWEYFIDANDGSIIFKANRIMDAEAIGSGNSVMGQSRTHIDTWYDDTEYLMTDYTRQANNDLHGHGGQMPDGNVLQTYETTVTLPGTVATDADNDWSTTSTQGPSVDAHVFASAMYDWLLRDFGRNSFNDAGASMYSTVNYSAEGNNNAYWNGYQIVVWSYGTGWRSLAGCPDVIAHEWAHAVTEYTSGLWYQKESGALNESFSDMMGCAFEFAHDTLDTPDWYMAENGVVSGNGFRNIADPPEYGDPDTYEGPYWQEVNSCTPSDLNDYCGVHTNSGVGNKWFYLLSDGDTHNGIVVNGLGVETAMQIAYRANAFYWYETSNYYNAALGTLEAANDLDPTLGYAQEVVLAWHAVNVLIPAPRLEFSYPGGIPHVIEPDNPPTFDVSISGYLGANPVPGSARMFSSIDGAAYVETMMEDIGTNQYRVTLPNVQCGFPLTYYFSVEAQDIGIITDPVDIADAYKPIISVASMETFYDDFETDLGWTFGGTATAGDWEKGTPVGDGSYGDPTDDYNGSGQCYLTGNSAGDSDVDGGSVWLESPVFYISEGGGGEIFFAAWFNTSIGPNPLQDVMTVSISNNNGADWVLAKTIGPAENASGDWLVHNFMTGDFVSPSNQMKIRFEVADTDGSSWVEAAIDDVHVIYYDCPTYTCGDLNDDGNVNILDIVYLINNKYKGGPDPVPLVSADVNHDGLINILDIVHLINFKYKSGPDPVCQ